MKISHKLMRMFLSPISPFSVLLAGIYTFMWGVWIATPMWEVFAKSPIYMVMDFYASEAIVGGIQMVVGMLMVLAAFDSIKSMKWACFIGFCTWVLVTLAFVISDWHNAGMWVVGHLAATHGYMFLNTAKRDS